MEDLDESWGDPIKTKSYRTIVCATCMSSDRKLFPVLSLMHIEHIWTGIGVQLSQDDHVCWECKALLRKFAAFRSKALQTQTTIDIWSQMRKHEGAMLNSLSSLTYAYKSHYDSHLDYDVTKLKMEAIERDMADDEFVIIQVKEEITTEEINLMPIDKSDFEIDANDPEYKVIALSEREMLKYRKLERDNHRFKKAAYKCDLCLKYFKDQKERDKHKGLHLESQGAYSCPICSLRYPTEGVLKQHVKTHYRCYECRECGHRCTQRASLLRHAGRKHGGKNKCTTCRVEFDTRALLQSHREASHADEATCKICARVFKNKFLMRRHVFVTHTDAALVQCDACPKQFRGEWRLKAHKRVHENTADENAYCAECGVQFKTIYLYRAHLKTTARHVDPADRKFECSDCGKRFVMKPYLQLHIELVHLKKSNYICDLCGQSFNARLMLARHKREKHTNRQRKTLMCDICGKGFKVRKSLKEHKNIHTGKRPFECKLCKATFSYSAALYNHNRLVHLKRARGRKDED